MIQKFECILPLTPTTSSSLLKRLALFYDKIHCISPSFSVVKTNARRKSRGETKVLKYPNDIDSRVIALSIKSNPEAYPWEDKDLPGILKGLAEAGILSDISIGKTGYAENKIESFRRWREQALIFDINNPDFNSITGTSREDYRKVSVQGSIFNANIDGKDVKVSIPVVINEPFSSQISQDISESMFIAEAMGVFPVFDDGVRPILQYKYRLAQIGAQTLESQKTNANLSLNERIKFSDALFHVSNELFQSSLIDELSVNKIVNYREALEDSRRKFLVLNMVELLTLINSAPWTEKLHGEVNLYVRQKLMGEISKFNDQSKEVWDKMFGRLTVSLTRIAQFSALGGTVGGISGSLIPNMSPLQFFLFGVLGGIIGTAPDLVESLVDSLVELRAQERNSIAYLANLISTGKRSN